MIKQKPWEVLRRRQKENKEIWERQKKKQTPTDNKASKQAFVQASRTHTTVLSILTAKRYLNRGKGTHTLKSNDF